MHEDDRDVVATENSAQFSRRQTEHPRVHVCVWSGTLQPREYRGYLSSSFYKFDLPAMPLRADERPHLETSHSLPFHVVIVLDCRRVQHPLVALTVALQRALPCRKAPPRRREIPNSLHVRKLVPLGERRMLQGLEIGHKNLFPLPQGVQEWRCPCVTAEEDNEVLLSTPTSRAAPTLPRCGAEPPSPADSRPNSVPLHPPQPEAHQPKAPKHTQDPPAPEDRPGARGRAPRPPHAEGLIPLPRPPPSPAPRPPPPRPSLRPLPRNPPAPLAVAASPPVVPGNGGPLKEVAEKENLRTKKMSEIERCAAARGSTRGGSGGRAGGALAWVPPLSGAWSQVWNSCPRRQTGSGPGWQHGHAGCC